VDEDKDGNEIEEGTKLVLILTRNSWSRDRHLMKRSKPLTFVETEDVGGLSPRQRGMWLVSLLEETGAMDIMEDIDMVQVFDKNRGRLLMQFRLDEYGEWKYDSEMNQDFSELEEGNDY